MENTGWFKLHRKFIDWEWFDDAKMVKLYIYFLARANLEAKQWQGITVGRGCLVTGRHKLARDLNMTVAEVRGRMDKLRQSGEIKTKSANKYTLVTLVNYNLWQGQTKKSTSNQPRISHESASKSQSDNKRITTPKEVKNLISKEYINTITSINNQPENFKDDFLKCLKCFKDEILPPKLDSWAQKFDELHRIDKNPTFEIFEVVHFIRNDKFWKSKLMSMLKLRRKDQDGVQYYERFKAEFLKSKTNAKPTSNGTKKKNSIDDY